MYMWVDSRVHIETRGSPVYEYTQGVHTRQVVWASVCVCLYVRVYARADV